MKQIFKRLAVWAGIFAIFIIISAFILDVLIMPAYVDSEEKTVPNVVGIEKSKAEKILNDSTLQVVIEATRYDEKIPKDHVIYQKPEAGNIVKENRRIHLFISAGNPLTQMPNLFNKTVRDAEISLSRLGYKISNIEKLTSDEPINTILEQSPDAGSKLEKNSKISVKVSTGPSLAKVRVPDLYGLSLREATIILESNSLVVGNIKYESSGDLLPNTVITQLPSKNNLVSVGESVDLFVTKN